VPFLSNSRVITCLGIGRVDNASELLSKAFEEDPVITYMFYTMSKEKRLTYLPKYFDALLTAATINHAIIDEIGGWKSCGILVPPGHKVKNPFTLLPAGILPTLYNIGFKGCQVTTNYFPLLHPLLIYTVTIE
jgi:hypothetical protein